VKNKMKKILSLSVAVFAFALVATPALASSCCGGWFPQQSCCPEVTVDANNHAFVLNSIKTISNTGKNLASGWFSGITSGTAVAGSDVQNQVGVNEVIVAMPSSGKVSINVSNGAGIKNMITTVANSGKNIGGSITAGSSTAGASIANFVGSNVVKITK
jgi:hypothetical protein